MIPAINRKTTHTTIIQRVARQLPDPAMITTIPESELYWMLRYEMGYGSGAGSYGTHAEFKANVLNTFVREKDIKTIVEFGSGDGNQLKYSQYPSYIGFDVSATAIYGCRKIFKNDPSKQFRLMSDYQMEKAQLTLSLDVIYHLIEDEVYAQYMKRLFDASDQYVIIYSSNSAEITGNKATHIRHRHFSKWIENNKLNWKMVRHIPNERSNIDFFIYRTHRQTTLPSLIQNGN